MLRLSQVQVAWRNEIPTSPTTNQEVPEASAPAAGSSASERRRGLDRRRESDEPYQLFRRYIALGGWFGQAAFLLNGVVFGFYYGGLGGMEFFTQMWLIERGGQVTQLAGIVIGIAVGLLAVWAVYVIGFAILGALLYWWKFKSFPVPSR